RNLQTGRPIAGKALEGTLQQASLSREIETNRFDIGPYLARINVLGIVPTVLCMMGLFSSLISLTRTFFSQQAEVPGTALAALIVFVSLLGYTAFLIQYPSLKDGDTIKASYLLQIFPFLAVLGAATLDQLAQSRPKLRPVSLIILLAFFAHNLPVLLT